MLTVWALDGLARIAPITGWTDLKATERDLGVGEWSIQMPLGGATSAAALLRAALLPGIEVVDESTGWRFAGFQTARGRTLRSGGRSVAWFSGLDFQATMQDRLNWPDPADIDRFYINSVGQGIPLTGAAHTLAYFEFGPGALVERRIPWLVGVTENDPGAGPNKTFWSDGSPILELFRSWFAGTDWTVRIVLDRSTEAGALRFVTPARETAKIPFELATGSIETVEEVERASSATRAIQMGKEIVPGDVNAGRHVAEVHTPTVDWRTRYTEAYRDRQGLDAPELADETADWATELGPTEAIQIEGVSVSNWGRDYDIGWYANAKLGRGEVVTVPIVASHLHAKPGKMERTVSLGTESLPVNDLLAGQITALAKRVRQVERSRRGT